MLPKKTIIMARSILNCDLWQFTSPASMESLPNALLKLKEARGLDNRGLASLLSVDPPLSSRLVNGQRAISYGVMSRLLVKLTADETRVLLQAYFDDELERIREERAEKAAELGVKLQEPDWPHAVKVVAKAPLKRTR